MICGSTPRRSASHEVRLQARYYFLLCRCCEGGGEGREEGRYRGFELATGPQELRRLLKYSAPPRVMLVPFRRPDQEEATCNGRKMCTPPLGISTILSARVIIRRIYGSLDPRRTEQLELWRRPGHREGEPSEEDISLQGERACSRHQT